MKRRWIRRRALAFAVAALGVVAISGTALAGHQTSGVKSYTGCLVSGDGVLIKIKEGNAPRSACTGGQVEAHFSGGDITKISVGSGLSTVPADGANGEVRIVLDASHSLPQGCDDGEVAKWETSTDPDRWVCRADNDTTYAEGTGLDLSAGNEFSIEPGYRLPGKACTTAGQFTRGFDSSGNIQCAAPASTGPEVWQVTRPASFSAGSHVDLPKGEGVDLLTLSLPAGTFLVTAVATVGDWDGTARGDEEVSVYCKLRNNTFADLPVKNSFVDSGEHSSDDGPTGTIVIHGLLTLASPEPAVRFTCFSQGGDSEQDQAQDITMTAVMAGTVHTP